jgi:hypothetical protein
MVKGISRQVIVVHAPDPKLFEQAIFILKDGAMDTGGVTDEQLLKEAQQLIRESGGKGRRHIRGPLWAFGGAALTGIAWVLTVLF